MAVNVKAELLIKRPREDVAAFAMNPDNDPVWNGGISEARMLTEPPLGPGTRVERVASFLGRSIEYVMEVVEYDPLALLGMRSIKGPFPMRVAYEFEDSADGTLARIRVQGDAGGFYSFAGPVLSRAVKRNITKDLKTLKRLMESSGDTA